MFIIYSLYILSLVISEAEFFFPGYETYMMAAMSVLLIASIEKLQDYLYGCHSHLIYLDKDFMLHFVTQSLTHFISSNLSLRMHRSVLSNSFSICVCVCLNYVCIKALDTQCCLCLFGETVFKILLSLDVQGIYCYCLDSVNENARSLFLPLTI